MLEIRFISSKVSAQTSAVDTDVVAVYQDSTKKAATPGGQYAALVGRLRNNGFFTAAHGLAQYLRFGGKNTASDCMFVGLGQANDVSIEKIRAVGGHAWTKLKSNKSKSAAFDIDSLFSARGVPSHLAQIDLAVAFIEGLLFGAYEYQTHKTKQDDSHDSGPAKLILMTKNSGLRLQLEKEVPLIKAAAEALNITRDWSNEPSNYGTPEFFSAKAKKLASEYGLKCTILNERDAARQKMGLFLAVGQGAEREGRVVVLEYMPKGKIRSKKKTVALVGKGITFDSGGISIKPSLRMEEMKHDMTGAATVLGAILLAARLRVPNRVVAVMAFTENMPDGKAIQPGNVVKARSGKTVEIINTDAEGRLILADVLDYAHDFKPDAIIDVATLTGAVSVALGKYCCAVLGNDDSLIDAIRRVGNENGERIWQLPLYDDYFDDLKSDTADMKNSANDAHGGTIRGAIFLKQFIRKGMPWAHLDIAATSSNLGHIPYYPKRGASGAYVRTLAKLIADF